MGLRVTWTGCAQLIGAVTILGCGTAPERFEGEPLGEQSLAAEVCAAGEVLEGIDVSHWQSAVDWPAVAGDGIEFAIVRVNHGQTMDTEFEANWLGTREQGVVRGAYQYFDAGGDPEWQAGVLIDALGVLGPGDLPPVIDVESTDGQTPSTIAANVRTWVELVEAGTGRRPIIYTGSYFWNDNVHTTEFADDGYRLWIAHYTTGCPNLPTAWDDWAMWQYTSTGAVAGVTGNVDRDHFNGSLEQLHDLAANGYRAEVVAVRYPAELETNEVGTVEIEVQNVGARTWPTTTHLGTTEPRDRPSPFAHSSWLDDHRVLALEETVAPGETVILEFALRAPAVADDYQEFFNLLVEGVAWFSDINPGGGPMDDEIQLDVTVTSSGDGGGGLGGQGGGTAGASSGSVRGVPDTGWDGSCSLDPSAAPSARWASAALLVLTLGVARRRRRSRCRAGRRSALPA